MNELSLAEIDLLRVIGGIIVLSWKSGNAQGGSVQSSTRGGIPWEETSESFYIETSKNT